jgi:hypothetical protein
VELRTWACALDPESPQATQHEQNSETVDGDQNVISGAEPAPEAFAPF